MVNMIYDKWSFFFGFAFVPSKASFILIMDWPTTFKFINDRKGIFNLYYHKLLWFAAFNYNSWNFLDAIEPNMFPQCLFGDKEIRVIKYWVHKQFRKNGIFIISSIIASIQINLVILQRNWIQKFNKKGAGPCNLMVG